MTTGLMRGAWVGLLAVTLASCAAQEHIGRGDELRAAGKYHEAIATYEKALRVSPGNKAAQEGIRAARRDAVSAELDKAKKQLTKGEYAAALVLATRARRMPLDLDEIALVQEIDNTIAQSSRRAEEQVERWTEQGVYILAVELADQIVRASPGVESRRRWGDEMRAKAAAHFQGLATELIGKGLVGSAAMQLSMARQVGAKVPPEEVLRLWDQFTEPVCFAAPRVDVQDKGGKAKELVEGLRKAAAAELDVLRARCGEGTRALAVRVVLDNAQVVDNTTTEQVARPLPGSGVSTEETYYDEKPYVVDEQYTEYEKRIEKKERRDCAPRPGKARGCETWLEDVEVSVPVEKTRRVTKVERIKRTRPAKGPFPPDKVVMLEITAVERRVTIEGTIQVEGAPGEPLPFAVDVESRDLANDEVRHPKMLVKKDPMEAKSMPDVIGEAAQKLTEQMRAAVQAAVVAWGQSDADLALQKVQEKESAQAEELYLRQIALGVHDDPNLKRFFKDRYGKPVGAVIDYLLEALGQRVERRRPGDQEVVNRFPKRGVAPEESAAAAAAAAAARENAASAPGDKPDVSQMEDDDMRALEEASFEEGRGPEAPAEGAAPATTPGPGSGATPGAPPGSGGAAGRGPVGSP